MSARVNWTYPCCGKTYSVPSTVGLTLCPKCRPIQPAGEESSRPAEPHLPQMVRQTLEEELQSSLGRQSTNVDTPSSRIGSRQFVVALVSFVALVLCWRYIFVNSPVPPSITASTKTRALRIASQPKTNVAQQSLSQPDPSPKKKTAEPKVTVSIKKGAPPTVSQPANNVVPELRPAQGSIVVAAESKNNDKAMVSS